jgi:hypothetical protein
MHSKTDEHRKGDLDRGIAGEEERVTVVRR